MNGDSACVLNWENLVCLSCIARSELQTYSHQAAIDRSTVSTSHYYIPPTIILLIGIWMIFTKNPMKPIIRKPKPVARAILANSVYGIGQYKFRWWRLLLQWNHVVHFLTSVVGFSALLDQVRRVFNELSEWLDDESVDVGHVFDWWLLCVVETNG